jgi:hypothetical protein
MVSEGQRLRVRWRVVVLELRVLELRVLYHCIRSRRHHASRRNVAHLQPHNPILLSDTLSTNACDA